MVSYGWDLIARPCPFRQVSLGARLLPWSGTMAWVSSRHEHRELKTLGKRPESSLALRGAERRQLLFVDEPCVVECKIRNISEDGALLRMLDSVSLPAVVLLWEQRTGAIHECQVRWRRGQTVGVRFADACGRAMRRAVLEEGFAPLNYAAADALLLN